MIILFGELSVESRLEQVGRVRADAVDIKLD
jgi:hypothetical protein